MPKNRMTFSCNCEYVDHLFCQLEEGKHNRGNDGFLFFNRAEREALSGGHFWYHLSGARHGQCEQTSAINDTNLHNTNNLYSLQCFSPSEINDFILILCLSRSFSSQQTSIFPSFYFSCVHYCRSFNSSFHALQKAFFFRHQLQCLLTFFSTWSLIRL